MDINVVRSHTLGTRRKPTSRQVRRQGRRRRFRRRRRLVDADDGDGLRASQERCGVTNGARRQTAAIPCDANAPRLKRTFMRIRDEEHRTARLKENFLRHGVVECAAVGLGLQHNSQVIKPRRGADGCGGFERKVCERLEAISYASVARFGFKDGEGGIGPRQCAFTLDLKHRRDRRAAVDRKTYTCSFIAD